MPENRQSPPLKLPGHVAENVLASLCLNKEAGRSIAGLVEPNNFDEEAFRTIATLALEHWKTYKSPPGKVHIGDLLAPILTGSNRARSSRFRAIYHSVLWANHEGINAK